MDWKETNNALVRTFSFADFTGALAFVNRIGDVCEAQQHHADICIHNYNRVTVTTTTHDAGNQVTKKDHALAAAIDALQSHQERSE